MIRIKAVLIKTAIIIHPSWMVACYHKSLVVEDLNSDYGFLMF